MLRIRLDGQKASLNKKEIVVLDKTEIRDNYIKNYKKDN